MEEIEIIDEEMPDVEYYCLMANPLGYRQFSGIYPNKESMRYRISKLYPDAIIIKEFELNNNLIWQTRDEFPVATNPLQKLKEIFAFTSRDCSEDKMIACIYGIVMGWDDASYKELKAKHNWSDDDVKWQQLWHENYKKAWNAFMQTSAK